jgi:S1-C subfamily serine protease/Tfp pilus assembly protein PilF
MQRIVPIVCLLFIAVGAESATSSGTSRTTSADAKSSEPSLSARESQTVRAIFSIAIAVEAHAVDNDLYPEGDSLESIRAAITPNYIREVPLADGWGTPMTYRVNAARTVYRIVSAGADRTFERGVAIPGATKEDVHTPEPSRDIVFENGVFVQSPPDTQRYLSASRPSSQTESLSGASKVFAETAASVLMLVTTSADGKPVAFGSGFVVSGRQIVTNAHVVRGGTVHARLGKSTLPLKVDRLDTTNDLAVLSSEVALEAKPLALAAETPPTGSTVYAIGNPAGLERSISSGILSGVRSVEGRRLLQISAPVSHGSSGGPLLDDDGQVIGVTVAAFEDGQNLNFAVPSDYVIRILRGEVSEDVTWAHLEQQIKDLRQRLEDTPDSPTNRDKRAGLQHSLQLSLEKALTTTVLEVSDLVWLSNIAVVVNEEFAVAVAARAVRMAPGTKTYLALGRAQLHLAQGGGGDVRETALKQAEEAFRAALRLATEPSAYLYFNMGLALSMLEKANEAELWFLRALEMTEAREYIHGSIVKELWMSAKASGRHRESDQWFERLSSLDRASAEEWKARAEELCRRSENKACGEAYKNAAVTGGDWVMWCNATVAFARDGGDDDGVLYCGRKCLSLKGDDEYSKIGRAQAHQRIARVLNKRGVFEEALTHARAAKSLLPNDASTLTLESAALLGLNRGHEAIAAAKEAVRLSDGGDAEMHYYLGRAYYEQSRWSLAMQSFERAAELDPKHARAALGTASCLEQMGHAPEAARWYEEALRRNPAQKGREDILERIRRLGR